MATPPENEEHWNWATLVPHALHRSETGEIPAIATDGDGLSLALARAVGYRIQLLVSSDMSVADAGLPHIVIVLDAYRPLSELQEIPLLQEMLIRASELEITLLVICDTPGTSPAESTAILTVDASEHGVMRPARSSREGVRFRQLSPSPDIPDTVASALSSRQLVTDLSFGGESTSDLLLDLIGFRPLPSGSPSWQPPGEAAFLTATFGVQADGRPFRLNLKEGAVGGDGPHGLLVGATGSGKSELLRSMVTALALTHSPAWLQMAFIDFKGGSAFESLAELPHCVGLITNILEDLSLIERMRNSLTGEMLARQRQLASAGPDLQGIRDYLALRDTRPDLPPMPYLLVVIDEFAELLEVEPAFLELLLAIGRQGRSLGIHLILSSQRLEAGKIRGLESYLSYRIALRTFNADESNTVIGSKAAAELPPLPGHGYFRAADTFQRFKAAQVSVDGGGSMVTAPFGFGSAGTEPLGFGAGPVTDLTRVIAWLAGAPKAPALWLPPLPSTARGEILAMDDPRLDCTTPSIEDGLPVAVGLLDDPQGRQQDPATFDAARLAGHVAVIGAPQSGKSSAMAAHVLQAARTHPASLLRFFILDFGGGLLAATRALPNVGAYATPQEPDRVARIVTEMLTLLDERPLEFRRDGITAMAQQRQRAAQANGSVQAHTVLVIDNYRAFKDRYPDYEPVVERVLIEGANFGLHLHLTSSQWNDINARKLEQIATRIELRLNQPADSQYGRQKAAVIQTSGPGRALSQRGMQMQFTAPFFDEQGAVLGRLAETASTAAQQAQLRWNGSRTPALLLLDDLTAAGFRDVAQATPVGQILLGVNESGFRPALFEPGVSGNLLLFGDLGSGRTTTLARMLSGLATGGDPDVYVVDFRGDLLKAMGSDTRPQGVATSPDELKDLVKTLAQQFDARLLPQARFDSPAGQHPIMLVVDDFELVQVMTSGLPGSLLDLAAYLLLSERLHFSALVNQLAANSMARAGDAFIKRALESGAWRMHFSVASRAELLPNSYRGRRLSPGVATLLRSSQPDALIQTLCPE